MARKCELTGKAVQSGNTVSNANNRARTRNLPNLSKRRIFVPELKGFITVRLSQRALKTIDKVGGLVPACRKNKKTLSLSLQKVLRKAS
jgi:large subunit ribosomal protein L28